MPFTLPHSPLRLRPIRLDDVDAILSWVNDPEITANFATMGHITREQEIAYLERTLASDSDRLYAIETHDGVYLGNAGLHRIYWPARNGRLGVVIGTKAAQGRGLGQEAIRLLVALGFLELGLHKIWAVHYVANARMRHILGKLGFEEEGILRDEYFHEGAFHDMVRHALLEPAFRAGWGRPWAGSDVGHAG